MTSTDTDVGFHNLDNRRSALDGHSPKLEKCCRRSSLTTAPSSAPGPFGPDHMLQLVRPNLRRPARSEEHTSELQSLMRISYAVFCLKKKKKKHNYSKEQG